jgi:hypothetical protein
MTADEAKVLLALSLGRDEFGYYSFAAISYKTCLDRKAVREACRSLTDKGLATYGSGLWDDEGKTAGSGYAITRKGWELVSAMDQSTSQEPIKRSDAE